MPVSTVHNLYVWFFQHMFSHTLRILWILPHFLETRIFSSSMKHIYTIEWTCGQYYLSLITSSLQTVILDRSSYHLMNKYLVTNSPFSAYVLVNRLRVFISSLSGWVFSHGQHIFNSGIHFCWSHHFCWTLMFQWTFIWNIMKNISVSSHSIATYVCFEYMHM